MMKIKLLVPLFFLVSVNWIAVQGFLGSKRARALAGPIYDEICGVLSDEKSQVLCLEDKHQARKAFATLFRYFGDIAAEAEAPRHTKGEDKPEQPEVPEVPEKPDPEAPETPELLSRKKRHSREKDLGRRIKREEIGLNFIQLKFLIAYQKLCENVIEKNVGLADPTSVCNHAALKSIMYDYESNNVEKLFEALNAFVQKIAAWEAKNGKGAENKEPIPEDFIKDYQNLYGTACELIDESERKEKCSKSAENVAKKVLPILVGEDAHKLGEVLVAAGKEENRRRYRRENTQSRDDKGYYLFLDRLIAIISGFVEIGNSQ